MFRISNRFSALYWSVALISAVLVGLWADIPLPLRPLVVQEQRVRSAGLVYGEQRISQVVAVPRSGISAIAFWLLSHRTDASGTVMLRVTVPERPDDILTEIQIPVSELQTQPPVRFQFASFTQSATPVLVFTLSAPDLDRAHALSVLGGDNTYGQGLMLINNTIRPAEDLAFRAFVSERQGDAFLPLSRIAQGRPGLLGQPAFYGILLSLGVWAYGWGALWVIRWIIDGRARSIQIASRYITRRLTDP